MIIKINVHTEKKASKAASSGGSWEGDSDVFSIKWTRPGGARHILHKLPHPLLKIPGSALAFIPNFNTSYRLCSNFSWPSDV